MNAERLILLGQLKEAMSIKSPNRDNHCRGLINSLIAMETEQKDKAETEKE